MNTAKVSKAKVSQQTVVLDWLRIVSLVLVVVGIVVAGYMAWAEVTNNETVCMDTGSIDCAAVQDSAYAKTFGIPVALLGLLGYVAMGALLVLEDQVAMVAAYGRSVIIGMALFGTMFQTYLTYIEASVLEKWCQWCVASFIVITALFIVSAVRFNRFLQPLRA